MAATSDPAHEAGPDYFALLGFERDAEIDEAELERRFLAKSRECHPDLYEGDSELGLAAQSALNDAHRVLADRWQRLPYLVELMRPGTMDAEKQLDPAFLMEAMERVEAAQELATSGDSERITATRALLGEELDALAERIAEELDGVRRAAKLLHRVRYLQRGLAALNGERQGPAA